VVPASQDAPVGLLQVLWMHFPWPVHGCNDLVLAKFYKGRAVGVFHGADGDFHVAQLVNRAPVCSLSILIY
jgi:hypothetical protein